MSVTARSADSVTDKDRAESIGAARDADRYGNRSDRSCSDKTPIPTAQGALINNEYLITSR